MKAIICTSYFIFFILLSCNDTSTDYHAEITLITKRIDKIELKLNRIDSILTVKENKYEYQSSDFNNDQIATEYIMNMFLDSILIIERSDTLNTDLATEELIDSSISIQLDQDICEYLDVEIHSITYKEARVRVNGRVKTEFKEKGDIILDKNKEEFEITEISLVNKSITLKHIQSDLICIVN